MNKVILLGRLTKDPELKYVGNGQTPLAQFTLAVNRNRKSQDGERKADFINIELWNKPAEVCYQYCKKGSLISIEGSIIVDNYISTTGEKKTAFKVRASKFDFANYGNSKKESEDRDNKYYEGSDVFKDTKVNIDAEEFELPF